jgi:hypothetical protein
MFCMLTVTGFGLLYSSCTVYIKCIRYRAVLCRQWIP